MKRISIFFAALIAVLTPMLSSAKAELNIGEMLTEYDEFKRRTAIPDLDYEFLDNWLDEGDCTGAELEEKHWTFYYCKKPKKST